MRKSRLESWMKGQALGDGGGVFVSIVFRLTKERCHGGSGLHEYFLRFEMSLAALSFHPNNNSRNICESTPRVSFQPATHVGIYRDISNQSRNENVRTHSRE